MRGIFSRIVQFADAVRSYTSYDRCRNVMLAQNNGVKRRLKRLCDMISTACIAHYAEN